MANELTIFKKEYIFAIMNNEITANMSEIKIDNYHYFEELSSTNLQLQQLLTKNTPAMTVVRAGFQNAGRGQMGNSWESEKDKNLLFSVLLKPHQLKIQEQFYLSKAVSVAITSTLNDIHEGFELKWPNDIYYDNNKIGGILIENNLSAGNIESAIAGIGININQANFTSDAPNPVSLATITGIAHNCDTILVSIIESLGRWIYQLNIHNFPLIDKAYLSLLYRRTGHHMFSDAEGQFEAEIIKIEPEGYLVLRDRNNRIRTYAFKEVSFII